MTFLLSQLNSAASSLSQAEMSYARGDYNGTATAAAVAVLGANSVIAQAQSLKTTAQSSSQNAFWALIAFSVVGIVVFVSVLFLVWLFFKRRYLRNISEAKPEVIDE